MGGRTRRRTSSLPPSRVLIVEDELLVAMELQDLLEAEGLEVLGPVPSVARAMELLTLHRPDFALLDVNLDGHSAAPIAAALAHAAIPYVLVTGYRNLAACEPELARAPRVDKPVDHRKLLNVLAQMTTPPP